MELTNDEAKLLAMMLVEGRGGKAQSLRRDLTPHGREIFDGLIDKLAAEVLGVDSSMMWHGRSVDPERGVEPQSQKG